MKRYLVTGATGFLGVHLVDTLLTTQPDVCLRLLCRGNNRWMRTPRVEMMFGDILDAPLVERAIRDVDGIFHLAGFVTRNASKAPQLFDTHIRGAQYVCSSAVRNGSPRVVLISSSGAIAAGRVPVIHNEDSLFVNDCAAHWPYYLSKIYQEKLAISFHENEGLPVIIASPSLLLGPEDERLSSTADILLFLERKIPNIPSGGLNFIDVRDAAQAIVRSMTGGVPGRRYLLGGYNMTVKDFFGLLERVSGVKGPKLEMPESWSRAGATLLRSVFRLVGAQYPLDDATVEMAYRFWYFDSARAKSELGLHPRPAEETIRDTIAYLRRRESS